MARRLFPITRAAFARERPGDRLERPTSRSQRPGPCRSADVDGPPIARNTATPNRTCLADRAHGDKPAPPFAFRDNPIPPASKAFDLFPNRLWMTRTGNLLRAGGTHPP